MIAHYTTAIPRYKISILLDELIASIAAPSWAGVEPKWFNAPENFGATYEARRAAAKDLMVPPLSHAATFVNAPQKMLVH